MAVKAIPEGFRTLTPHLSTRDAAKAIEFYKKAFGAEEVTRMTGPGGQGVMHAELRIGDSLFMMADEMPQMEQYMMAPQSLKGTTVSLHIYVEDTDAAYKKALDAGATEVMKPSDMFWGDRYSKVRDPFGHEWGIATHQEDVSPEECGKRAEQFFADMAKQGGGCG